MAAFELVAHRGFPRSYPENTLIGFEQALAAGARFVETDVQLSQDQEPLLFHDRTLERVCGLPYRVDQLPCSRLKRLSAFEPHRFGERFRGYRIAHLRELVDLLDGSPGVTAFIELKAHSFRVFERRQVVETVLETLLPLEGRALLLSSDLGCLAQARALGWGRVAVVLRRWADQDSGPVLELEPEVLFCNRWKVPFGALFGGKRQQLAIYDLSHPHQARRWAERGATYLETFDIAGMLAGCAREGAPVNG